jgi:hypothetical protein
MTINVQKPHEISTLVDPQTRNFGAKLLGAMIHRETGEPAPQRLHFRPAIEPEQSAECGSRLRRIARLSESS